MHLHEEVCTLSQWLLSRSSTDGTTRLAVTELTKCLHTHKLCGGAVPCMDMIPMQCLAAITQAEVCAQECMQRSIVSAGATTFLCGTLLLRHMATTLRAPRQTRQAGCGAQNAPPHSAYSQVSSLSACQQPPPTCESTSDRENGAAENTHRRASSMLVILLQCHTPRAQVATSLRTSSITVDTDGRQ